MKKFFNDIIAKMKDKFKEDIAKFLNNKLISFVVAIITAIVGGGCVYIYNVVLYPTFSGNIEQITYEANLGIQNLNKNFSSSEKGLFYYYEGSIEVIVNGKGKIKSAYFIYNDNEDGKQR